MKILFLTQVLPYPLDAGPKVRAYHMLRRLASRHEVTLVAFVRPDDPPDALAHLRGMCAAVHAVPMRRSTLLNLRAGLVGLLTGRPVTIARNEMPEMASLLRRLVAETAFDVVHADQLSMAWWSRLAVQAGAFAGRPPRALLDEHNAIYLLTERMAAIEGRPLRKLIMRREARAFRRYEAAMLRLQALLDDELQVKGGRLQAPGKENLQPPKITVVPICVDPEQVAVTPRQGAARQPSCTWAPCFGRPTWPGCCGSRPRCCPWFMWRFLRRASSSWARTRPPRCRRWRPTQPSW